MTICTPWRPAASLEVYKRQLNEVAPSRSKLSDGTIGDAAHQAEQCSSDHNSCCVKDSKGVWVITAEDYTHDPIHGADMGKLSEALRLSRDPRIAYVIFNRRIFSSTVSPWVWRTYSGSSPHTEHMHVSVRHIQSVYDNTQPWALPGGASPIGGDDKMYRMAIINGAYFVGDRIWHRRIQNWAEHEDFAASGVPEKDFGANEWDAFGWIGRADADAASVVPTFTDEQLAGLAQQFAAQTSVAAIEQSLRNVLGEVKLSGGLTVDTPKP
jgi:hypothetical protein